MWHVPRSIVGQQEYFLSLDLDFFNQISRFEGSEEASVYEWLHTFSRIARFKGIPVMACMNHQQMLPWVSQSSSRVLVNLDEHSDLNGLPCNSLNCGSWVSYVSWRSAGTYVWVRPCKDAYYGECSGGTLFSPSRRRRVLANGVSDWLRYTSRYCPSVPKPSTVLSGASFAYVCMSPDFAVVPFIKAFRSWIKDCRIPYIKGTMNERRERKKFLICRR
jgi:hypothetical protein